MPAIVERDDFRAITAAIGRVRSAAAYALAVGNAHADKECVHIAKLAEVLGARYSTEVAAALRAGELPSESAIADLLAVAEQAYTAAWAAEKGE
jgi:hypothetical protein